MKPFQQTSCLPIYLPLLSAHVSGSGEHVLQLESEQSKIKYQTLRKGFMGPFSQP